MEIKQIGEHTYYIPNATNIGIYKSGEKEVFLIDSGNDKDAGKKILKLIEEKGWHIEGIISTHANADHIGGNKIIQEKSGSPVLSYEIEEFMTRYPILEPAFLYGGYPFKDLQNKFLCADASQAIGIEGNIPREMEFFPLNGHYFNMIGIKTPDDVYFLADSLFNEKTISKYHIFYIYNVKEYLNTLDYLCTLKGKLFIPSHCEPTDNIRPLIDLNRKKIEEISNKIYKICGKGKTFEQILKCLFEEYDLTMNLNQFVLVGSTLKSYISYLCDENKITYEFIDNQMIWKQN